jgi:hypothetical protein
MRRYGVGPLGGVLLLGLWTVLTPQAYSGTMYTAIDIGTLPGYAGAFPFDINSAGDIVGFGFAATPDRATGAFATQSFIYSGGTMRPIGTAPAQAINNRGQVATATSPNLYAYGINNSGAMVGIGIFGSS